MISANQIAAIIGDDQFLGCHVDSLSDLRHLVESGLPKKSLSHVFDFLDIPVNIRNDFIYDIIPEGTYKRRREKLKADESEKVERIARIVATAMYIWDNNTQELNRFLLTSHPHLEGKTPLEVSKSELGARQVEELLWKIFYGLPV